MDFLKVSDKKTNPCRSDSLFGLNQKQCKKTSFGHREMEIHTHPHFTTPYAGNGVLGCYYPFTNAQLKELERRALIYKYMIASVPVPFDLLVSSSSSSAPFCNNRNIFGDLEPGAREDAGEQTGRNGDAREKSSLITNTVRDIHTEAVLVQESMWNFLILVLPTIVVVPRKTEISEMLL